MVFRPALRPGAVVLRRDATHLQVGTSPGVVIDDCPGLVSLLLSLDGAHDVDQVVARSPEVPDLPALLARLRSAGVVVDADGWSSHRRDESRSLALAGRSGDLAARRRLGVALHADSGCDDLASAVATVLAAAGVDHLDQPDPDLLVVAASGEPARSALEEATRSGVAHLVVRLDEDRVVVGPLVVPGATPCITCHDLHRADWDPAWPALLPQLGRRSPHHNPPAPGALLLHAAAVEVAAAVIAFAEHDTAPLAGALLAVGPHHAQRDHWPLRFHPRCLCALLPVSRTAS